MERGRGAVSERGINRLDVDLAPIPRIATRCGTDIGKQRQLTLGEAHGFAARHFSTMHHRCESGIPAFANMASSAPGGAGTAKSLDFVQSYRCPLRTYREHK